ncbi:MAG: kelch repeat-containing protein [Bacteroidota bacterium]|nr:kelch repeat-containing protein [Bacteroidota bacterium]MDP4230235.1 kelch repeat-containing protein [Bacteroidota bacterium]MDP4236507.1 kelch repeat-containing protein [Bacteroidota bacterium]
MWKCWLLIGLCILAKTSGAQSWGSIPYPPGTGNDGALAFSIAEKFYYGGGKSGKELYEYYPRERTWTKKFDLPGVMTNRLNGIGFSIGMKGYVGLGLDTVLGSCDRKKDLWEYDAVLDSWSRKADFPDVTIEGNGVFVLNGKAYIGGGDFVNPSFYQYDPASDKWTKKEDIPAAPRGFPAMFSIGSYGYWMGGETLDSSFNDFYRYDPSTNAWTALPVFPGLGRAKGVAFAIKGKGYLMLGEHKHDQYFYQVFSYDTSMRTWSQIEFFPSQIRTGAVATVIGDTAYIGTGTGIGDTGELRDWWSFTPPKASAMGTESESSNISFYPQPAQRELHLRGLRSYCEYKIRIFDQLGRAHGYTEVMTELGVDPMLDISRLTPGVYMVMISNGTELIKRSVVKE